MCGVAGAVAVETWARIAPDDLDCMIPPLRHRGPDDEGVWCDPALSAGLAHTRLSIVDLRGGAQPMATADGALRISFNGEIFNYIELREELRAAGYAFRTQSDTEVVLQAYAHYGEDFVRHLNGQFAIALWDARRRRMILVRDRVGILPLFYTRQQGCLLFASEVKALLPCLDAPPRLRPEALAQTFTFWAPEGASTLFAGIEAVQPGHMLVVGDGAVRDCAYWKWEFPEDAAGYLTGDDDALAEELFALLDDAVRIRLRADVPVGGYLSGGLDSSTLVALMQQHIPSGLRTFSIGFDDPAYDEGRFQQQMVAAHDLRHRRAQCGAARIAAEFPAVVAHTETAILRTAPAPMRVLSRLVRDEGCKVVLTGEGADEVLGGYDLFKEAKIRQFWARQPESAWRPHLLRRLYPYLAGAGAVSQSYRAGFYGMGLDQPERPDFSHMPRWNTTAQCQSFFAPDFRAGLRDDPVEKLIADLPPAFVRWHPFNRAQYLEARTLMSNYLLCSQGDRMLMANGVEGRFPFLDHRVIAFANRLPPRLKMRGLEEKYLLKRAMRGRLPPEILARKKQPYRAPDMAAFFKGQMPEAVAAALSPDAIQDAGYFDAKKVELLCAKARRSQHVSARDNMAFVGIVSTQLWHQNFIVGGRQLAEAPAWFAAQAS